jgi:hypothetical protein
MNILNRIGPISVVIEFLEAWCILASFILSAISWAGQTSHAPAKEVLESMLVRMRH